MRQSKYEPDWQGRSFAEIDLLLDDAGCPKLPDLCPGINADELDIGQIIIGRLKHWTATKPK